MNTPAKQIPSNLVFYILVCGYFCISLGLNNGFILGGLTAFDAGFLASLDISVAQLKLRDSMTFIIIGVFALATGALVDKLGALRVLLIGHILFGLAFWLLSTAKSIETIYAAQAILGLCQLCAGYLVCVIAVSRYLPYKSGLAIGLMMAATSFANALLPGVNAKLIENFGASQALVIIALSAVPLAIGALMLARIKPRGDAAPQTDDTAPAAGPTLGEAVKSIDFWAIAAIAIFSFFCFVGIVTNIAIFAGSDAIGEPPAAAQFFFALFIVSLFTQVIAGWLADKVSIRGLHIAGLLAMSIACFGLAISKDVGTATLWFGVLGLGWGFNYVFVQIAVPKRFAGQSLGKIFGAILFIEAAVGAAGPFGFGTAFDLSQSYTPILYASCISLVIASLAAAILHRPLNSQPAASPA